MRGVVVVLRREVWLRGQKLPRRGPHGCLRELAPADAARLVADGAAEYFLRPSGRAGPR